MLLHITNSDLTLLAIGCLYLYWAWLAQNILSVFLGYTVKRACPSPRNSTWFIRLFFLMKGCGLGTRLDVCNNVMLVVKEFNCPKKFCWYLNITFNFSCLCLCVCVCVDVWVYVCVCVLYACVQCQQQWYSQYDHDHTSFWVRKTDVAWILSCVCIME